MHPIRCVAPHLCTTCVAPHAHASHRVNCSVCFAENASHCMRHSGWVAPHAPWWAGRTTCAVVGGSLCMRRGGWVALHACAVVQSPKYCQPVSPVVCLPSKHIRGLSRYN
jgi:hypothetical protein